MKLFTATLLLIPCITWAQVITGLDADGNPVKLDPVTEQEYTERAPKPTGQTIVRSESELVAAVVRGDNILIPDITIEIRNQIMPEVRWTTIRGLSKGKSRIRSIGDTADRILLPIAADLTIDNITFDGGVRRVDAISMDGRSRGADRMTITNFDVESVGFGVLLSGGPTTNAGEILEDLTLKHFRMTNFSKGGIYVSWEILRPRIQDFYIAGRGVDSSFNGIWIGFGVVDGFITDGIVKDVNRHGIEVFFPHSDPAEVSTKPLVTKFNPYGPAITMHGLNISDTGEMGFSISNCLRANVSQVNIRNSHSIGAEFVGAQDIPTNFSVTGVSTTNTGGTGISIDRVKGGVFSQLLIDGVTIHNGQHRGLLVYLSDDVTIDGSRITNAGNRYIEAISSTRTNIINNQFTANNTENTSNSQFGGNFAILVVSGDCYFNSNRIRRGTFNSLRCGAIGATIMTSPTSIPFVDSDVWVDGDNWRGTRFVRP